MPITAPDPENLISFVSLYSGFSVLSLYFYCAYNAVIFASLLANMEAFSLFRIGKVKGSALKKTKVLSTGIWVMLQSLLDSCLNYLVTMQAWEVLVLILMKEELAVVKEKLVIWKLYNWLANNNNIFLKLA